MNRRLTIAGAVCLVGLLALGACGRKGDLEPPPGMTAAEAAKTPGCRNNTIAGEPVDEADQGSEPIDITGLSSVSGNTNRMPDTKLPPC